MKTTRMMCRLALGALLVLGCDRSDNTPKSPTPAPPSPDVTPKAGGGGAGSPGATANQPADDGAPLPDSARASDTAAPTTRPTGDAGGAAAAADLKAAEQTKQAQELLEKAIAATKDKRFDEARASLDKIEAMGNDLPTTVREQVVTLRKSLDNLETAPTGAAVPPPPAPPEEVNK